MKRKVLSTEELAQVVKLRQSGASWMKIQKETGIPRRVAKRVYGESEETQWAEELKEARKGIMTEELRKHLDTLVDHAQLLVDRLGAPESPHEKRKADQVINQLLETDIYRELERYRLDQTAMQKRQRQIIRHNQLLFQCLQDHTRSKVDWEMLDRWKEGWDDCVAALKKLREKIDELIGNYLSQDRILTTQLEKDTGKKDLTEKIAEGELWAVWWAVTATTNEIDDSKRLFHVARQNQLFKITFAPTNHDLRLSFHKEQLARTVANICNSAIKILYVEVMSNVANTLTAVKKAMTQLEEMLDPLRLRPLILRTRCELCPA